MQEEAAAEAIKAPAAVAAPVAESTAADGMGGVGANLLAIQRAAGNRAAGAIAVAAGGAPIDPRAPGSRSLSRAVRMLARDPKLGPGATIPERRGDVERGVFGTTEKTMYGVRASGSEKPEGLWVDHFFDTQAEAEDYARRLAATGESSIRDVTALPLAWPAKDGKVQPGNPVTHVYVIEVPPGTSYIQGVVAPQPENVRSPLVPRREYAGGGPQIVMSWEAKTKAVASFPVADRTPDQTYPGQDIPAPPEWVGKKPPMPPPAAVTSDDPKAMAKMMQPALVREYKNQQALRDFARSALDDLETYEEVCRKLGKNLPESEAKKKALLTAQLAAAEKAVAAARADHEMLDKPNVTPKEVQDMLARRGVAVAVTPQTNATGTAYTSPLAAAAQADFKRRWKASKELYDTFGDEADNMLAPADRLTPAERKAGKAQVDQIGGWSLTDKGFTTSKGTAATTTVLGHGSPISETKEATSTTTIGAGNVTNVKSNKTTAVGVGGSASKDETQVIGADIVKGEATYAKGTATENTDAAGNTVKTGSKTTYVAGVGGITKTKDDSSQIGDKFESKGSSVGVVRTPGMLGVSAGQTEKKGTMVGPPGQEKMDKGTEKNQKITGGLVSDEKGTGLGGVASQDRKTNLGDGKSVATTVAAGGRCQALVKEIPGSEPVRFTILTTISFDIKLGATAGKEWEAKPGAQKDSGLKANGGLGGGASLAAYASFKRELSAPEAQDYVRFIKANGRGSKLPEHKILATGANQGWESAKRLWAAMNGSPDLLKTMKPGEEVESNVEVGGDLKANAGAGESRQGGTSVGAELTAKGKHKINVKKSVMADGKIQVTATIDDEGEVGGALSAGYGPASMKAGKSYTSGMGRTMVFILDPKDPAFDSQIQVIDAAVTPADLDRVAAMNESLLASRTNKTVEGEGTTVGAAVGPLNLDMGGKGKLTSEETRDAQGNLISSKYTGENQGGGTIGVGDVKIGDSKSESYVGEVDAQGNAKGELTQTTKSSSFKKTVLGAGSKITTDPLGTIMNPGKLIEDEVESKGTAIADAETMTIVWSALDTSKWNGKVGGHRHDDWVTCGKRIRAACVVKGKGREREIVSVNKHEVQAALAAWHKADSTGRAESVESIIRPLGGVPAGKAFAFPDGTENMKPDWDALVIADPLGSARQLLKSKPAEALAELKRIRDRISSLSNRIKSAGNKWEGLEIQHAEMMGHINARVTEVDAEIRAVAKSIPPPAPAPGKPAASVPTAEEVKKQEMVDKTAEVKGWLETYNNNIQIMKGHAEAVFGKLGSAEARIKEDGFFVASKNSRLIEVTPVIKQAEDLIKLWDRVYWETFELYKKISPWVAVDRARLEAMHTAGANGRWRQVYDMTRDKSMAGR